MWGQSMWQQALTALQRCFFSNHAAAILFAHGRGSAAYLAAPICMQRLYTCRLIHPYKKSGENCHRLREHPPLRR
jgi:hypothetical protein